MVSRRKSGINVGRGGRLVKSRTHTPGLPSGAFMNCEKTARGCPCHRAGVGGEHVEVGVSDTDSAGGPA